MESACDSCSLSIHEVSNLSRLPTHSPSVPPLPIRKLVVIQARHGKPLRALAQEFGIGIRTIRTWLRLYACCGFQALGHKPKPGRPPCLSHAPMQRILATLRDKSPDQLQFEFACRSLQIVRPGTLDQFPVQLFLAPVRRVLRRLGLTPAAPSVPGLPAERRRGTDWDRRNLPRPRPACAGAGSPAALGRRGRQDLARPPGRYVGLPGPDARRPAHGGAVPG